MIHRVLRQPLFQFLVIGVAIFAAFALLDDTPDVPDQPQITVSLQDAQWLASQFEATWRRQPTPDELSSLMDEFVREEVYVREALSLGLDQGDQIVRRRLRQKMEFLTEAGAEAAQLDEATLRAFYVETSDTYRSSPRVAMTQILLPDTTSQTIDGIRAELEQGVDPGQLGARTLLPPSIPPSPQVAVDNAFGQGFFDAMAGLDVGVWTGPVTSGFGAHLVRVDVFEPGTLAPFEQVRDRVELEWRQARARELRTERFELMRDQYLIEKPDPAEVLSQ